jgi:hypothetical protein
MSTKRPPIEDLVNERPPIEELSEINPLEEQPTDEMSYLEKGVNLVDIPASLVRTGVEAAISPEREVLPELKKQFGKTVESPFTAAAQAPRGSDINELLITEVMGETPEHRAKLAEENPIASSLIKGIAGFTTETVLDPFTALGFIPKTNRIINTPIVNVADRQAAKVIARATPKAALESGKNIGLMSKRLVAEDLHGLLTNPSKILENLTGSKTIDKIRPESLQTLRFEELPNKKGLISEVSNGLDETLNEIKNSVPELKSKTYPLDAAIKVIQNNLETNQDLISGQTVDLSKVGEILDETLKPFKKVSSGVLEEKVLEKIPGELDLVERIKLKQGAPKTLPSTLSLTDVQKLRKNIGRLLSDRSFYSAPDKAMSTEKEVLLEVYRTLGDMIHNDLKGIKIRKGNQVIDAGDYYVDQNARLKQLMDIRSIYKYAPKEQLSQADMAGTLMSLLAQGGVIGSAAVAGEIMGIPQVPAYALLGGAVGAGLTAGSELKKSSPEYLSKILSAAAKVSPVPYTAPVRGAIQYMRQGQPVSEFGREPQSVELTPKDLIKYRIPRSTQGILENKEKVLAKLSQQGVPKEMIHTVAQAMNGEPDDLSNVASIMVSQFPDLFEKSRYMIFDGKFLNPNDKAKAADDISKRDNLDSIQRAKMISKINKTGEVPEGL